MIVVTDVSAGLPERIAGSPALRIVRGHVWLDGEPFTGDLPAFWSQIRSGAIPTTTPPAVDELVAGFTGNDTVLAVHVSGELSATVHHALEAARQVAVTVTVVDSRSIDVGTGLVVAAAHEAAVHGTQPHDAEAVADLARRAAARLHTFAVVNDVEWLYRSGRTGLLPSARLSRQRPLVLALRGRTVVLDVPKRRDDGVRQLATHAQAVAGPYGCCWAVSHGDSPDIDRVVDRVADALGGAPARVGLLGPAAGAHLGPGAVVIGVLALDARAR